jgi:LPPG:FO 2-phospho-L-lactate transferase
VIATLAGGVGAAKFLVGLARVVDPASITAIVNVADDDEFHGLHVSPDLDSVTYALGGVNNIELGWGRADETFRTVGELARFDVPTWFRLGDLDLATHLYRTEQLRLGRTLSAVTDDIVRSFGISARLIPVSDDRVRTVITTRTASEVDGPATQEPATQEPATQESAMQEWFVRDRCEPEVVAVRFDGATTARPAAGVLDAIEAAETIVICPSNPVISIGPVLAIPGVREALTRHRAKVVGVSPIVGGAPVRGPADRLMAALDIPVTCVGVAESYRDFCAAFVIDDIDASYAAAIEAIGPRCTVANTMMVDEHVAAALAKTTLEAVR